MALGPARPPPSPREIAPDRASVRRQRLAAILPFADLEPGCAERAAALEAQVKATGASVRTLNRWAALYAEHGYNGLARKRPSNADARRVHVSGDFDRAFRAAGHGEELLAEISAETTRFIKGLWKSRREAYGWAAVGRDAETLLENLCDRRGVQLAPAAFRLSRRRVEAFAGFRVVNTYRNDRKAWEDAKPRSRRDWSPYAPMDVVVADVKPLDVAVKRPDGSIVYPRVIGFLDAATFRLFSQIVFLPKREGVRQEHVHEAFLAMVQEPGWGFPKALYLDNGSEFGALYKLGDAMALLSEPGARTIIKARPYNASAKPVESAFKRLDLYFTCILPGYAGPERMRKKTQTVGRPPAPYPHSAERFCEDMQLGLADLNHKPMTPKRYEGRSPVQMMEAAAEVGWRPVAVDPLVLDAAFCTFETRKVGRFGLRIGGKEFPVADVPSGSVVSVALPWRRDADALYRPSPHAGWRRLAEDVVLPALWIDGAKESGRRDQAARRAVRDMERSAPEIDQMEPVRIRAAKRGASVAPRCGPVLDAGGELASVAAALRLPRAQASAVQTEADRQQRMFDARTARLQKSAANG